MSVTINDVKMESLGLILLDGYVISAPEVKTNIIDIPGGIGVIDQTEIFGFIPYYNREIEMEFVYLSDSGKDYHIVQSNVMNFMHGKQVKIVFDNDLTYYWLGRATVESVKNRGYQTISVTVNVDPIKYSVYSSAENWIWDTFNFLTDAANQLKELQIVGWLETVVLGSVVPINPIITASNSMLVEFENERYPIHAGTNKYYNITLRSGKNKLRFIGDGYVTIDVRGGSL